MNDVHRLLELMADRSDGVDLPDPAVVRRVGQRRTRRAVALTSATALALVVATVVGLGVRGPERTTQPTGPTFGPVQPHPVAPLGPGLLTYLRRGAVEVGLRHGRPTELNVRRALCGGCGVTGLAWSPDGRRLALLTTAPRGTGPGLTRQSIWVVERASGRTTHVADCRAPGNDGFADCGFGNGTFAWSPDSASVAFPSAGHIFTAHGFGSHARAAATADICARCSAGALDWSPDGQWIAYTDGTGIAVVSGSGGVPVQVAKIDGSSGVSWSPDGARLAVEAPDGVHVVDLTTATPTAVLAVPQNSSEGPGAPAWSPDGKRLAFFSTPSPGGGKRFEAQLGTVRPDGTHRRILQDFGCCTSDWSPPQWSPDGTRIAMGLTLTTDSRERVVVVDAHSGAIEQRLSGAGPVTWDRIRLSSR